jgi:hypothetical protein
VPGKAGPRRMLKPGNGQTAPQSPRFRRVTARFR